MRDKVDFLIVGAGWSGMTVGHQLCQAGYKVAIVDQRDEVGGNAVERKHSNGAVYHPYGPHIFQTNSQRIKDWVLNFTDLTAVDVRVSSFTQGRHWSFPVNLQTYRQLVEREASREEFLAWLHAEAHPAPAHDSAESQIIKRAGRTFYELFYKDYIWKMWGRDASALDPSVGLRVPVHTDLDETYLAQRTVALPSEGYGALFRRMLQQMPDVDLRLGKPWREAQWEFEYRHLIFTGPIDEYFHYYLGSLPYRSINFTLEGSYGNLRQLTAVVATPDLDTPFTRHTELGHLTGQRGSTVIVSETPVKWQKGVNDPLYPLQTAQAARQADAYREMASRIDKVTLLGRLGSYRYYNMDQAIGQALTAARELIARFPRATSA